MANADSYFPDLSFERKAAREGYGVVAGVDEAGCAPWAGPVVAAAVVLDWRRVPKGIDDSKKLTPERREALFGEIMDAAVSHGIGVGDVARIDRDNILNARLWAMAEALSGLAWPAELALVDGNRAPAAACECRTVVSGDQRSLSIAAASILAKVTRDRLMRGLDGECPGYGFARHKGYGTPEHQRALRALGPTAHHRRSFAPVRAVALLFAGR